MKRIKHVFLIFIVCLVYNSFVVIKEICTRDIRLLSILSFVGMLIATACVGFDLVSRRLKQENRERNIGNNKTGHSDTSGGEEDGSKPPKK